jgi:hypothetical protein
MQMSYNDAPLYERAKGPTKPFDKPKAHKTAIHPSPIVMWHEQESLKRAEGKYNEIDGNYMKAALLGVINQWSDIVNPNKKLVEDFFDYLESRRQDYAKAKEIWERLKQMMENKYTNVTRKSNELPSEAEIQPEISGRDKPSVQGAAIDAARQPSGSSVFRGRDGLLEARSTRSYFEEIGLASPEGRSSA